MKRMVLKRDDGIMQIFGWSEEQPEAMMAFYKETDVPIPINLVQARATYWLYVPVLEPPCEEGAEYYAG